MKYIIPLLLIALFLVGCASTVENKVTTPDNNSVVTDSQIDSEISQNLADPNEDVVIGEMI